MVVYTKYIIFESSRFHHGINLVISLLWLIWLEKGYYQYFCDYLRSVVPEYL